MTTGGRIYSVGYEGLTVEALVEHLIGCRVTALFDVRLNPSSRRPGFSRKALSDSLVLAGVAYVHEPDLGNPANNRDSFRIGNATEGRKRLRAQLENGGHPALSRLAERARSERVAVLCVERESSRCHRQVITEMAKELAPELEISNIL